MSLESALDEERREVMALLEGKRAAPRALRANSPHLRAQSPVATASPVRSMLDVGPSSTAPLRQVSISGFPTAPLRGVLDPPRSNSTGVLASPPPSATRTTVGSQLNPERAYQFEMLPTVEARSMPKRVTQGGKRSNSKQAGSMSTVYGPSSDALGPTRERERYSSLGGFFYGASSGSPGPGRSASPGGRKLNNNSLYLMSDPKKVTLDSGKVVDMHSAYRRLSDAALLRSGGSLAKLPVRKGSDPLKGVSLAPGGGERLATDDFGDDEAAIESSDGSSSGAETWTSERSRGRRRTRLDDAAKKGNEKKRKQPKSLLAAAEDERKEISSIYKVRSLLEPTVTLTGPDGTPRSPTSTTPKKSGVHPNTNFDHHLHSGRSTPLSCSDTEADISEIRSAQQLSMQLSAIHSNPEGHRCVRQIIRGRWRQMHEEAAQGMRRQRVYLVATDLSEEAAYALEWTIGTVLRDGDTLLAVYAVDEEMGTGAEASSTGGTTAQQESASLMKTLANPRGMSQERPAASNASTSTGIGPSPLQTSTLAPLSPSPTPNPGPDVDAMSRAERERYQAATEVSDRCVKLLRKTRLQARVVVEVFHCKSPKHMLTEVIDFLEPTLVILGSRGRNALKGVLLGSFSNYLVTKSSVPVMVARKRLRKHSKYKRKNLRFSNVLVNPSDRLASAKID